jgi:tRNA threonylcarbamoyladenosine biosynthesis protein TsaE
MKTTTTNTIEDTVALAEQFVKTQVCGGMIVCLQGELGAGKTTFTQGILKVCGAEGPYTSPTFNIVKEYNIDSFDITKIYHIDAYRIGYNDMDSIGWGDMVANDKALIIIEWPKNIEKILPQNIYVILCEMVSETQRKYTFDVDNKIVIN